MADPAPRQRESHKAMRERIITAAESLLASPSRQDFTLNQIADQLGVHYTAVYHYFKNRDDLELQMIQRYAERRSQYIEESRHASGTAADHLAEFVNREMHEQPNPVILRGRSTLAEPYRTGAIEAYQETRATLTRLIEDGQQDRSLRAFDPPLASHLVLRILDRYASYNDAVFTGAGLDAERLATSLVEFFADGMAPQAPLRHTPPPQFRALGEQRISTILSKAAASFNTLGWRGTSLPQIAKEMGLSKSVFYRYAASKEELLFLCANHTLSLLAQLRQTAMALAESPLDALLLDTYFLRRLLSEAPGPLLSPYLFDSLTDPHQRVAHETFTAYRLELVDLLQQCVDEGLVRPLDARAVQPMITACSYIQFQVPDKTDDAACYHDPVIDFLLHGLQQQ